MNGFLEGMGQRLLLGYCADSILNRKNRNTEIEGWFEDNQLDHLFYDVLLFIMEYSLSESGGCSLYEISQFLMDDVKRYKRTLSVEEIDVLSSYMVKDILQNKGSILSYRIYSPEQNVVVEKTVRLIEDRLSEDNVLLYKLSEQGYDFLLRTKEIDSQFEGWVSMLITKQQLERRNYKESFNQARQSLQVLRKQESAFNEFLGAIRRDLNAVENHAYSQMLSEFYENLKLEQEMTLEVNRIVTEYRTELSEQKDRLLEQDDTKLEESLKYLKGMADLLETIMETENSLLKDRFTVREIFEKVLEESLMVDNTGRRYNLYQEILFPTAHFHDEDLKAFLLLKRPLLIPKTDKILNIGLLYAPERNLADDNSESEVIEYDELEEDEKTLETERRVERYVKAFKALLKYAENHERFYIRDYVKNLDIESEENDEEYLTDNKSFYLMILDLFSLGQIDMANHSLEEIHEDETLEEFDIHQILKRLEPELAKHPVQSIRLQSEEDIDYYQTYPEEETIELGMNSIEVTVIYKEDRSYEK